MSAEEMKEELDFYEWLKAVAAERARQKEMGYDWAHDRKGGLKHLFNLASGFARKNDSVKTAAMIRASHDFIITMTFWDRLKFLFKGRID